MSYAYLDRNGYGKGMSYFEFTTKAQPSSFTPILLRIDTSKNRYQIVILKDRLSIKQRNWCGLEYLGKYNIFNNIIEQAPRLPVSDGGVFYIDEYNRRVNRDLNTT